MGKIKCICGNIISDVCYPNPSLGHLTSSYSEDEGREDDDISVLECNICGSLLIDDPFDASNVIIYQPTDKKYHEILKEQKWEKQEIDSVQENF